MTSYAHLFQNLIVKLDGHACHNHNLHTKLIHIYLQNDPGTHKLDPPSPHMVSRHWQTGCFLETPNQTINIQLQQILPYSFAVHANALNPNPTEHHAMTPPSKTLQVQAF